MDASLRSAEACRECGDSRTLILFKNVESIVKASTWPQAGADGPWEVVPCPYCVPWVYEAHRMRG